MSRDVWKHAIKNAPVPERAQAAWEQLRTTAAEGTLANADAEQARILSALWSGSEWATEWLRKHPEWLGALTPQHLAHPRQLQGLRREVEAWFAPLMEAGNHAQALAQLRQFKQREMRSESLA